MKSKEMFKKLGFDLYNASDSALLYKYETDYEGIVVYFDLQKKTYHSNWSIFVDNGAGTLIPMAERPQNVKHSAKYGYWQIETYHEIDIELHNAIHQQMIELGWIE